MALQQQQNALFIQDLVVRGGQLGPNGEIILNPTVPLTINNPTSGTTPPDTDVQKSDDKKDDINQPKDDGNEPTKSDGAKPKTGALDK